MSITLRSDISDAAVCRGWPIGTRLVGDEGRGQTVIEITAIGETHIGSVQKCSAMVGPAFAGAF